MAEWTKEKNLLVGQTCLEVRSKLEHDDPIGAIEVIVRKYELEDLIERGYL